MVGPKLNYFIFFSWICMLYVNMRYQIIWLTPYLSSLFYAIFRCLFELKMIFLHNYFYVFIKFLPSPIPDIPTVKIKKYLIHLWPSSLGLKTIKWMILYCDRCVKVGLMQAFLVLFLFTPLRWLRNRHISYSMH